MTVTSLPELVAAAAEWRHANPGPILVVVGKLSRSIEVDGSVVSRIGQVDGLPAYELVPRGYSVEDDGSIRLLDDHPDWLEAGNDEEETIAREDAELVLITTLGTDELRTPEEADNVFVYPEVSDDE